MGAICNGIALHNSGLIPYCATFYIFTDYMRAAMRVAALSQAGVIYGKKMHRTRCYTAFGRNHASSSQTHDAQPNLPRNGEERMHR